MPAAVVSPETTEPLRAESLSSQAQPLPWVELVRIGLVALAALASRLGLVPRFAGEVIALAATVVGGYPIYREAAQALWARRMTMELSMSIAIAAALVIREFFTAAVIV